MANPVIEHIHRDGKTYDVKDIYAERAENKTSELRESPDNTHFPTEKAVVDALNKKENADNKVSAWSSAPDDVHYPTEKLVRSEIDSIRTVVVDALPEVAKAVEGVNYIVKVGSAGIMYKLIGGQFCIVGGTKTEIADVMPDDGDEYTDYYIKDSSGTYVHYRYSGGAFVRVGTDAYSKYEVDEALKTVNEAVAKKEDAANKVAAFQKTPDDIHYPSEKLVKESLDEAKRALQEKIDAIDPVTSVVVSALPAVSDANVGFDYFLKQGSGILHYKVVDGAWKMVGGAMVSVVDKLPATGDEFTDYYVKTNDEAIYLHFRWKNGATGEDGAFYAVGADAYSKEDMDEALKGIRETHQTDKKSVDGQIAQANRNIQSNKESLDTLTGQQKTYSANLEQQGDNYIFQLLEAVGEGDGEIVSSFKLPATGGGGGGTTTTTTLVVERVTETPIIITPTDKAVIQVNFSSTDADGEPVDASYTLKLGKSIVMSGPMVPGLNTFDVTDLCAVGTQKFTLTVTDDGGSTNVKSWTVQVIDVRIETAFSDRYTNAVGKSVNFTYTPYGSVSKTVHFKLDGKELDPVITTASGILQSFEIPPQSHGAHLLEAWITATVNNKSIETDHIYRDIIWFDSASDDPVIGCIYRYDYYGLLKVRQYNSVNIPFVVYDPRTSTPTVTMKIDGKLVSEQHLTAAANTWAYKPDTVTINVLTITCRNKTVTIRVEVSELGYNIQPVTANLDFDFNPTGRTNSAANRLWTDANNSDVKMTVSDNFDWNNGGYQVDDDGNQYFCVKSGTRAYISHNLFGTDPKRNGAEFKVIFRTTNVRDKDALFLTCLTGNDMDKPGIEMRTHEARIYTSSDTLMHPYCEEDVVEFEYNINSIDAENASATSFVMTYEDGVAARPLVYPSDEGYRLYQLNPVPITIGSDDCDTHIYRMKAYSSALSDSSILSNFIADARDSDTMVSRYERNRIYNENNKLTPESVAEACPDLKIIKISCPYFTNDKKNYVKNTSVECIHKNGDSALDNWTWMNGYHVGQGTTSNRYGLAGRNIDLIFGFDGKKAILPSKNVTFDESYVSVLTLGDGTKYTDGSGKIALTRNSVPNNWFNIKVNIASSDNANNALLQKRYNDFLPYKTPAMRRDEKCKNSMEFVNCVVFVRETDPDITTHREFSDTNWHFYAIGNIGDSKKTDNTRVNDPTDMKEFVVEISDNTLQNSTFDTGVYFDANRQITYDPKKRVQTVYPITKNQWNSASNLKRKSLYEDWDGSFEFRYDMGTKDGETISGDVSAAQQEESKQVFRNMYEFVVTSTDKEFVDGLKNWFIVESPLYWYLFTERYTMIDNRAKNSFWHWGKTYISAAEAATMGDDAKYYTIDDAAAKINSGYRFDLWDYDNDTGLGIDNNGELNMTYGHEDTDYKTDGDPSSGYIFNAADSVFWCRIRDLMGTQLRSMYRSRESLNCWSATSLISEFDTWQEQFPEELWRLDIERKYLRPYYSGNPVAGISTNVDFLKNMMNGRKRYQRRQFERDQEIYMGTKYFGMEQCADSRAISFRCNTPQAATVKPDYTLRITPYSDMYLWVAYGNSTPTGLRAKAGKEYTFTTALTSMDDTMILVYCAENIQAINDLSACYIRANDFSAAKRLKTLIIGSNAAGYSNPFITTLSIKDNTLLETLDIRNCTNLTGSLNFSGCPNLLTLLAEGTSVSGVVFAQNGKIQSAHLPKSVGSLSFNNLQYLTDFVMESYENLVSLVSEYCAFDPYQILTAAINTLQIVRILGIDWTFSNTDVLNKIYAMSSSFLSGKAEVVGPIRQSEITKYTTKWTDLELKYDADRIIPQCVVMYCNYDGKILGSTMVDKGSVPPDPFETGVLKEKPTRESDQQYVYTFASFADMDAPVMSDKKIYATYTTETRKYTVSWYKGRGEMLPLFTKEVPFGEEAVYEGDVPTNYSEEDSDNRFQVFKDWDKSTGYVRGDMSVYPVFESTYYPDASKELKDMSAAEVFAVSRRGNSEKQYEIGDYIDIKQGYDPDFSNVTSKLIVENKWFDGTEKIDTRIKLFAEKAPSFTLAIDYEFLMSNAQGSTLAACTDSNTGTGFKLSYTASTSNASCYSKIEYTAGASARVGIAGRRNIIVLRYRNGEKDITVYSFHGSPSTSDMYKYDMDITRTVIKGTKSPVSDETLILGATVYRENGGAIYGNYAQGWIHWCKIWYDDLGDDVCKQLANWPRETIRAAYIGSNRQYLTGSNILTANSNFFFTHPLPMYRPIAENSNDGYSVSTWDGSQLKEFAEKRVFKSLPKTWQSAIKSVRVTSRRNGNTSQLSYSDGHLYLPSFCEVYNTSSSWNGYYDVEQPSGESPYFRTIVKKTMFPGIAVEDRSSTHEGRRFFGSNTDPTRNGYNVKSGDIWCYSNGTIYIFVGQNEIDKHSFIGSYLVNDRVGGIGDAVVPYDSENSPGLWVIARSWWTRSPGPYGSTGTNFYYMYGFGQYSYNPYSTGYYDVFGFSV